MRLLLHLLKPCSGLVSQHTNSAERKKIVLKMAIFFRSLKFAIGNKGNGSRTLLTASTSAFSIPYVVHPLLGLPCARLFPPLSRLVIPFQAQGPLFLSLPPWKLSQSATPLHLQGNAIVFQKVHALNLLRLSANFPLNLKFSSISPSPNLLHRVDFKDQRNDDVYGFLNLPNLISLARLFSGPLLGWMIANEWYSSAFMGLAVAGLSDWLDGYAARKMKINSVVGSYLDPLADKVLIGCVALAMVHNDLLHPALVGLVIARDAFLVGGAVYQRASSSDRKWRHWHDFFDLDGTSSQKVEPLFISKVNTVLQLLLVAAALAQPEYGTIDTQSYITALSWLVASTTVASTAAYASQYVRKRCTLLATKS